MVIQVGGRTFLPLLDCLIVSMALHQPGAGPHPGIRGPLPSNNAQLRLISSSIIAQLLAALQGGWVAGETFRQTATRRAAAAAPISAAQDIAFGGWVRAAATKTGPGGSDDGFGVTDVSTPRSEVGPAAGEDATPGARARLKAIEAINFICMQFLLLPKR